MTVYFEKVTVTRTKRGICPVCGRGAKRETLRVLKRFVKNYLRNFKCGKRSQLYMLNVREKHVN